MRSSKYSILLLTIFAALVVMALNSSGQTPPPASGPWDISDDTVYANTSIDLPSDIHVFPGASLTLINVDINLVGTGYPQIRVETGGSLLWDGGSLTLRGSGPPRITLVANCTINGVDLDTLSGITISEFGANVTNCTFGGSDSIGVFIYPLDNSPTDRPITVTDNTFTNMRRSPISGSIDSFPDTVGVVIANNVINGVVFSDGINLDANTPSAHIVVRDNKVSAGGQDGIDLNLSVDDLYLRLDNNRINDVDQDGIRITLNTKVLNLPGIVDLQVVTVGRVGLWIEATGKAIDGLVLFNHTNVDAGQAAIYLTRAYNVSMVMSHVDTSATDFVVAHSTLDIHQSSHERGSAQVFYEDSRISSWKWLEMTCVWQGGTPVVGERVAILGPVAKPPPAMVTGKDGHWGNQSYCDWLETESTSQVTIGLTPVLVHPAGNITAEDIPTDQDQVVTVTFHDNDLPTLNVEDPGGDVRQNSTAFTITGTCSDAHSGVALVQFSFDPNPNQKVWSNTTGTDRWYVDTLYMSEGDYTLYVRAFDWATIDLGRYTPVTVGQVVIDLTPPVLQVTSPDIRRQPVIVNTFNISIHGMVSEDLAELMVQGTTVPMTGTSFELEVMMTEGLNDVNLVATDLAGNIARFTFQVLRDTAPPEITLTAPAEGALLNATSVLVAGLLDELVQGDRIVINGATATLSSGAFELLLNSLDEGPSTIDVTAIDLAGNRASVSVDVIIDTLPPIMKLVSPNDGLLTRQATVLLEGTSEAGARITIQGVPVTMTGTTFTHSVDLAEGRNIIHVSSIDEAGNGNSTLLVVDRDSTPPLLLLYGLANGTVESEGDAAFVNGRTEPDVFLWMMVDGIPVAVPIFPDGSFLQPLTVDRLETAVTMRAEDAAGNTAFADVTVLRKEVQGPTVVPPPAPVDPVVTVAVVTMTTIVAVGLAMTFEFTKYALVLMVLPLYARIKKHEVLDNKTRLAIHGLVVENPGMHYNEIIREFALTNGVAAYHLDVLEREGFVRSVRDGTLRRFYSSSTKVPGGHKDTPDQMRERILEMVNTNPGINQKTIVDDLGIGRTLVGYHLKTLIDEGYIEAHKQGRFTVYSRTRKRWFRLN